VKFAQLFLGLVGEPAGKVFAWNSPALEAQANFRIWENCVCYIGNFLKINDYFKIKCKTNQFGAGF
jgi:hypothetical protein